jgi:hypothetical protein
LQLNYQIWIQKFENGQQGFSFIKYECDANIFVDTAEPSIKGKVKAQFIVKCELQYDNVEVRVVSIS